MISASEKMAIYSNPPPPQQLRWGLNFFYLRAVVVCMEDSGVLSTSTDHRCSSYKCGLRCRPLIHGACCHVTKVGKLQGLWLALKVSFKITRISWSYSRYTYLHIHIELSTHSTHKNVGCDKGTGLPVNLKINQITIIQWQVVVCLF